MKLYLLKALTACSQHTGRENVLCKRNLGHVYIELDVLENTLSEDL